MTSVIQKLVWIVLALRSVMKTGGVTPTAMRSIRSRIVQYVEDCVSCRDRLFEHYLQQLPSVSFDYDRMYLQTATADLLQSDAPGFVPDLLSAI